MIRAVPPYAFVVGEPSWGSDSFGVPSEVGVRLFAQMSEADQSLCADEMVGLVLESAEAIALTAESASVYAFADGAGYSKEQLVLDEVGFDEDQIRRWWQDDLRSRLHIADSAGCQINLNCFRNDGVVSTVLTCRTPAADHTGQLASLVCAQAGSPLRWHGFVAIGKAWFDGFTTGNLWMGGYGPVVLGRAQDMVLDEHVDKRLVVISLLPDGRVLLRGRDEADLVEAVTEIRRICWPGVRLLTRCHKHDPGTLALEGSSLPDRTAANLYTVLRGEIGVRTEAWSAPGLKHSVHGTIIVKDGTETHMRRNADLLLLAELWRRLATALTNPDDHGPDGLIAISVRDEQDHFVVEHGPCDPTAHDALVAILRGTRWMRILQYENAPVEVQTRRVAT